MQTDNNDLSQPDLSQPDLSQPDVIAETGNIARRKRVWEPMKTPESFRTPALPAEKKMLVIDESIKEDNVRLVLRAVIKTRNAVIYDETVSHDLPLVLKPAFKNAGIQAFLTLSENIAKNLNMRYRDYVEELKPEVKTDQFSETALVESEEEFTPVDENPENEEIPRLPVQPIPEDRKE